MPSGRTTATQRPSPSDAANPATATQPALRYSDRIVTDRASLALDDQTEVGSYFVATYPPFSVWTTEAVAH